MARLRRPGGLHDLEAIDAVSSAFAHLYYPLYAFGDEAYDFDPRHVDWAREALAALAAAGLPGHDRRRLARQLDKAVDVVGRDRKAAEAELRAALDFLIDVSHVARGYPPPRH